MKNKPFKRVFGGNLKCNQSNTRLAHNNLLKAIKAGFIEKNFLFKLQQNTNNPVFKQKIVDVWYKKVQIIDYMFSTIFFTIKRTISSRIQS